MRPHLILVDILLLFALCQRVAETIDGQLQGLVLGFQVGDLASKRIIALHQDLALGLFVVHGQLHALKVTFKGTASELSFSDAVLSIIKAETQLLLVVILLGFDVLQLSNLLL